MKHVKPTKITIELTYEEAKILQCVFALMLEDDPYGEASKNLGINIDRVVSVGNSFEKTLIEAL